MVPLQPLYFLTEDNDNATKSEDTATTPPKPKEVNI